MVRATVRPVATPFATQRCVWRIKRWFRTAVWIARRVLRTVKVTMRPVAIPFATQRCVWQIKRWFRTVVWIARQVLRTLKVTVPRVQIPIATQRYVPQIKRWFQTVVWVAQQVLRTLKVTVPRVQIPIATQRRAQKVRMAKLVRTEHQQVTWSTITVVANATRIFEAPTAKRPYHALQGTMDKPAKTMARRWVHLPQTTANVPVLWGTKGATANHQRNA
jgi:hypothetical protein